MICCNLYWIWYGFWCLINLWGIFYYGIIRGWACESWVVFDDDYWVSECWDVCKLV